MKAAVIAGVSSIFTGFRELSRSFLRSVSPIALRPTVILQVVMIVNCPIRVSLQDRWKYQVLAIFFLSLSQPTVMSGDAKNIILDRGNGTTCTINLHGATITSWKVTGVEQLFLSKKAIFDDKTPILGGVPIVFPHFADWDEKPFHGFARVCRWLVEKPPRKTENGDVKAVLKLMDTAWTRQFWDYTFSLTLEVVLGQTNLVTDISVFNPSPKQSFAFDLLLHTYFLLPDVTKCTITGFKGCSYVDKTKNFQEFTQETDVITVRKFTDNIYKDTASEHVISNVAGGKSMKIVKSNYPDTVVWNPWSDTVKNFPDLDETEYPHFFCVEAGNVAKPVMLAPGQTFKASQVLHVV